MISGAVADHLKTAIGSVGSWVSSFSEGARAQMAAPELRQEIGLISAIDGYHRIRQTTPLIVAAIQTLDARQEHDDARFWVHHLAEEYGHDAVMRRDIVAMIGDEEQASQVLARTSITPPSAALVGFFEWQVRHDDPHLLILLRLFLETFMSGLDDEKAAAIHALYPGGSETVRLHRDADQDHVGECRAYLDRHFTDDDLPTLVWVLDFIALCLNDSQSWIAAQVLGRRS
jgi:hypothetical protein